MLFIEIVFNKIEISIDAVAPSFGLIEHTCLIYRTMVQITVQCAEHYRTKVRPTPYTNTLYTTIPYPIIYPTTILPSVIPPCTNTL